MKVLKFVFVLATLFSCTKEEISVGNEKKVSFYSLDPQEPQEHRSIFAAIVHQGKDSWFFKLSGLEKEVLQFREELKKFIRSLKYKNRSLTWTVPSTWKKKEVQNQIHQELFSLGKSCELSITKLPYSDILSNVNRWRKQIGLSFIDRKKLRESLKLIQVGNISVHYTEINHKD